jgi:glycosyltransferase involved in cell wall biosynthesis
VSVRIVFAHLLNDASGSPRVLHGTIKALMTAGYGGKLYIGSDGDGCLSACGIPITRYWYRRTRYRALTLLTYVSSQIVLLLRLLSDRSIDAHAVTYVNTLLPFGAALYGWLTRRRVIYHVHEVSISPAPLRWLLVGIARLTSSMNIYVSDAHMRALPIKGVRFVRLYNALDSEFAAKASAAIYRPRQDGVFKVLMVASLRDYKGVPQFLNLAGQFAAVSDIRFDLVVNDEQQAIDRYFAGRTVPKNVTVHPRVADTSPFYGSTSLVLNLSRVDAWVETFGMTVLEAMSYGVPVIVPPVGGPAELVVDGLHGYQVDSRDAAKLHDVVQALYEAPVLCEKLSAACRARSAEFSEESFRNGLVILINNCGVKADD